MKPVQASFVRCRWIRREGVGQEASQVWRREEGRWERRWEQLVASGTSTQGDTAERAAISRKAGQRDSTPGPSNTAGKGGFTD